MKRKLALMAAITALLAVAALPLIAQEVDDFESIDEEFIWSQAMDDDDDDEAVVGRWQMHEELALSKDQLKKMKDMRIAHQKEMIPLRAQIRVKNIELQELFTSDASQSAINGKIDEISKLKTDVAKKQAAHRIGMRQVLTPEQREIWNNRPMMGRGHGQGMLEKQMRMKHLRDGKGDRPRGRGRGL